MKKVVTAEIDALFALPLAEFTAARNALAKKLKQEGLEDEAETVKRLAKPSVSAWAANQLYWKHRREFDRLRVAGDRLAQAQASQLAGRDANLRGAMEDRREAVSSLLRLVDELLTAHGHGATADTLHRIQTTLETLSTSSALSDAPVAGRLTEDAEPLGFESLAALAPNIPLKLVKPTKAADKERSLKEREAAATRVTERENDLHRAEESLARIRAAVATAETAVHDAEAALQKAREELTRGASQE